MALRNYWELIKPQRTLANVYTAAAGFLFASNGVGSFYWRPFIALLGGVALVIASGCVANNYLDRELDARMARTRQRALPTQAVSPAAALVLAIILGITGFLVLELWVNTLVVLLGAVAYIDYVVAYGWAKRHSVWSTWIGTISGAMSLVAGYCAITDSFDRTVGLLFAVMVFWQMAHFYAIAIYRRDDYRAAGLPIWSVRYGLRGLRIQILSYIILFILAAVALFLTMFNDKGLMYLTSVLVLGLYWLSAAVRPWQPKHEAAWARKVFGYSLLVIMILPVLLALGPHLP